MLNLRQRVHLLLIISELLFYLSILVLSIIGCVKNPSKNERVWFCSKILTVQNIIQENMNDIYPLKEITSQEINITINYNYSFLLQHSHDCELYYKKCGILDTIGNIMCIPSSENCPINRIELNPNDKTHYHTCSYLDYTLYYTNIAINDNIIAKIIVSDKQPRYITEENFIFDNESYRKIFPIYTSSSGDYDYDSGYDSYDSYDGGGDSGGGDIGGGDGDWRILDEEIYGNSKITEYIKKKMEEENNIDNHYERITNNLYIRNYIGFETYEQMYEFTNFDFTNFYIVIFPNTAAIVFGYLGIIPFAVIIIFSITRFRYKDRPNQTTDSCCKNCTKAMVIIFYMSFFFGFFLYFLFRYLDLIKNEKKFSLIQEIKSEIFIEDFIEVLSSKNNFEKTLVIVELILVSLSTLIFIIAWVVNIISMIIIAKRNDMWNENKK